MASASAQTAAWPARPIKVIVPEGSMLAPRYPAAVVAGNVEVSQAVTSFDLELDQEMSRRRG